MSTPRSLRLHVGIFGRRNVGKSSLANALAGQAVALVSDVPGATADPVEKPLELRPLGPVLLVDTAGLDDEGALGALRLAATRKVFGRVDLAVVAGRAGAWGAFEDALVDEFRRRGTPVVAVLNQSDLAPEAPEPDGLRGRATAVVRACARAGAEDVEELRSALAAAAPGDWMENPPLVRDLLPAGAHVLLVAPIDSGAPRGRLILPQVRTLRDALDAGAIATICRDAEAPAALERLGRPPDLTIADSQAFGRVAKALPPDAPLTGFSVLFARAHGDLEVMAAGAEAVGRLVPGDRVLIAESCAHHAGPDDIGRVKIPAILQAAAGGMLVIEHARGRAFPDDLGVYALVVHCGGCMTNRGEILERVERCRAAGVAITNYGLVLARAHGILARALLPFGGNGPAHS